MSQPDSFSGHLMYVDSVYAKTFKEVAKLVSPMTTVAMSGCLSFQYQRSEERGNLFSVYTRDQLGQYRELWRAEQENQNEWGGTLGEWMPVQVDLKAPYSVQVGMDTAFMSAFTCRARQSSICVFSLKAVSLRFVLIRGPTR